MPARLHLISNDEAENTRVTFMKYLFGIGWPKAEHRDEAGGISPQMSFDEFDLYTIFRLVLRRIVHSALPPKVIQSDLVTRKHSSRWQVNIASSWLLKTKKSF